MGKILGYYYCTNTTLLHPPFLLIAFSHSIMSLSFIVIPICFFHVPFLDVVFRQIEIVLKDSTAFVYVTKSEKSSH